MIPFIRSLTELMVITKSRDYLNKEAKLNDFSTLTEDSVHQKRYIRSENKRIIFLPDLPKESRRKWIKSKKAVSKFLNDLDYNNQIQSSYDLTLLERQIKYDKEDVA